jgi:hypothetical protein
MYARIILELLQDGDESEAEENADGEDGTEDKNVCHTFNIMGYRLKSREERLNLLHPWLSAPPGNRTQNLAVHDVVNGILGYIAVQWRFFLSPPIPTHHTITSRTSVQACEPCPAPPSQPP